MCNHLLSGAQQHQVARQDFGHPPVHGKQTWSEQAIPGALGDANCFEVEL